MDPAVAQVVVPVAAGGAAVARVDGVQVRGTVWLPVAPLLVSSGGGCVARPDISADSVAGVRDRGCTRERGSRAAVSLQCIRSVAVRVGASLDLDVGARGCRAATRGWLGVAAGGSAFRRGLSWTVDGGL